MSVSSLVGSDIRALRKSRGHTIKELSAALNRSVGWLSQVERGQAVPSVQDLAGIATFFDVNISFFFRSAKQRPEERGLVLRASDRMAIGSSESGLTEELLSPSLGGSFEIIKSVFAPHSSSGGMRAPRKAEDGGVVVSGRLTLQIDDLEVTLEAGDSFQFAEREYGWRNEGDVEAVVIWVISPPIY
ncbi:helix-turn-helix domain-containing protein [Pararhodobacter sp. CCB-MM2]|uniref:helix-turn-helix domain-containing protein n=1 Tax=Pararhodobacter sp. CCB-MM2 TaxID=1786003 RepID=UPI00082F7EEC|nr:XRE family transcriptional regulator [Pararhodobacter sp. CCB-MM2]